MERLEATLRRIDGKGYGAYKDLLGTYRGPVVELRVDHVQGDPFAAPSRISLTVPVPATGLDAWALASARRRVASADFVTRRVWEALQRVGRRRSGSGKSGVILIDKPGQEILERSSCIIDQGAVELRLQVGLPAQGRRVLGREAFRLLCEDVPGVVRAALDPADFPVEALRRHVSVDEDQEHARALLAERGLVAFVLEGAVLPRRSGVDARPMEGEVVPFGPIPWPLRVQLELPHGGQVVGLGVPDGVTVIVGGGFHGKSTLLDALALGIYNHVPGDGRDGVVTRPGGMSIRAEDGRRIEGVDIAPFISDLPLGRDTKSFRTDDASGSTSQAAAIQEAVELGADALLIDEDTSANNFLVRDFRMQQLVRKDREPITPFIDRVRELYEALGVSTILVLGGSSDYLDAADTVIQMDAYRPLDVTEAAREICAKHPNPRRPETAAPLEAPRKRAPTARSFDASSGRRSERVRTRATRSISFGETEIELDAISQLVDSSQARAIGDLLVGLGRSADGARPLRGLVDELAAQIRDGGLAAVTKRGWGDRAAVRALDVGAAANRMRTLRVTSCEGRGEGSA